MVTKTKVYWNSSPGGRQKDDVQRIAMQWAAEGKTNGHVFSEPYPIPESGPYVVIREWTTRADAEAWINDVILPRVAPARWEIID